MKWTTVERAVAVQASVETAKGTFAAAVCVCSSKHGLRSCNFTFAQLSKNCRQSCSSKRNFAATELPPVLDMQKSRPQVVKLMLQDAFLDTTAASVIQVLKLCKNKRWSFVAAKLILWQQNSLALQKLGCSSRSLQQCIFAASRLRLWQQLLLVPHTELSDYIALWTEWFQWCLAAASDLLSAFTDCKCTRCGYVPFLSLHVVIKCSYLNKSLCNKELMVC